MHGNFIFGFDGIAPQLSYMFDRRNRIQTDPKRLKKELPKALKTIKGEDRLMLIGTTNAPFDGELKPMMSTYQKIILIPRPDYASRYCKLRIALFAYMQIRQVDSGFQA